MLQMILFCWLQEPKPEVILYFTLLSNNKRLAKKSKLC